MMSDGDAIDSWLRHLHLFRAPFIEEQRFEMRAEAKVAFDPKRLGGFMLEPGKVSVSVPKAPWVCACFDAALRYGDQRVDAPAAVRELWRGFLVMLEKTPDIAASIESVYRMGDEEQAVAFVIDNVSRFQSLMRSTPRLDGLRELATRRERRLDGRASRAPDALWEAEARAGRPASKRGALGPKRR